MTVDCGLERYLCNFLGGKLKWENTFPVWVQGPVSESSGRWLGDLLSSCLEFRCGGIFVSEKLLAPHLSPLQVSDLLTLGIELDHGQVNPFHSPFEFWDLLPKLNEPMAEKQDLSLSGWNCVIQSSFCKCQADISSPHIWLPVTVSMGSVLPGGGTGCTRGSGVLRSRLCWTKHRMMKEKASTLPTSQHPPPDVYNTPCFSLFKPKVLIQIDSWEPWFSVY